MSERREIRCLGVEAPGRAYIWSYVEEPLSVGAFQVETLYSGLSAGTELTFFEGTNPYLRARWNDELGTFEEEPAAGFPVRFLGYMEVGRVTLSRTSAVAVGRLVAMAYGHKTGHTANAANEFFAVLPPDLDPLLGIYVAQMGPIAGNGLLHAAAEARGGGVHGLGDGVRGRVVLVVGAGVVGLLTGLWARRLGAETVAVVDESPARLAAAEALGLTPVVDDGNAWHWAKESWRHGPADAGADVAFQCRGRTSALVTALRALRPQGTVIDLAFYQGGAPELRLGEEFHHNGLTIRCAQISRVPKGLAPVWGRARLAAETVELLRDCGQLVLEHIVTDVVPFEESPAFMAALAARERHAIQVVFEPER